MIDSNIETCQQTSPADSWLYVGPIESFPDIATISTANTGANQSSSRKLKLSDLQVCDTTQEADADALQKGQPSACKIFRKPAGAKIPVKDSTHTTSSGSSPAPILKLEQLTHDTTPSGVNVEVGVGLEEQILIFRYRGKMHAIDHQCPHRSYPLSKGSIYDIEDFGIVLSAGISCPKHGWTFDLFTGESDRGSYQLRVWDVEVRKREVDVNVNRDDEGTTSTTSVDGGVNTTFVEEVWIRKS